MVRSDPEEEKIVNQCMPESKDYKEGYGRYLVDFVCDYEGHVWQDCLIDHKYPRKCPSCGRTDTTHPKGSEGSRPTPKYIANFINERSKIIYTRGEFYAFDENRGVWNSDLAEEIIGKDAQVILGERLKKQDMENIKLHLKIIAKKNLDNGEEIQLYGSVKQEKNGIKINFQNGTLFIQPELEEINGKLYLKAITYSFYEHKAEDYFEKVIPWNFDPSRNKIPKKILNFLWYISNNNVFNFITLLEGMAWPFLPGYPIQQAFTVIGEGNNGKSTYFQIIKMLVGEENVSTLTLQQLANAGKGRPFQIVELENKLVNIADDLPNRPLADTGYFKQLTGGSPVSGEKKFGSMFKFENQAKMYFSANRMPEVNEDTLAWWRRFCFVILEKIIENPKEMQLVLKEFETEIPDLINFLIFAVLPNMIGKTTFTFTDTPELTKKTYESVSNTSIRFAEEKLKEDPHAETEKRKIREEYEKWCDRHNLIKETETKFWTTIKEKLKFEEKRIQEKGVQKRYLVGVRLVEEDPDNELENLIIGEKKRILENYIQKLNSLKEVAKVDGVAGVFAYLPLYNIQTYLNILSKINKNPGNPDNLVNIELFLQEEASKEILKNTGSISNIQTEIYKRDNVAGFLMTLATLKIFQIIFQNL